MATQPAVRYVTVGENSSGGQAVCKCSKGYKCVITKTDGSDAGKVFKCEEGDCICIFGGSGEGIDENTQKKIDSSGENAFCECGEGWSCEITKIDGSDGAPVPAFSCTGSCTCFTSTA